MKVLYVEDNPANVALVKRVARMGNHEIINYIDGDKAIANFDEIAPDLVLMDIQLAGQKTGLDVVKQLRAKGVTTTIIAVTAYAMVGDKERALDAGCDDYLPKPLPVTQLVKIFEAHSKRVAQEAKNAFSKPQPDMPVAEATADDTHPSTTESKPDIPVAEATADDTHPSTTESKPDTPVAEATADDTHPSVEESKPDTPIAEKTTAQDAEDSDTSQSTNEADIDSSATVTPKIDDTSITQDINTTVDSSKT